jgi:predicted nucleic acid-binding protein
VIVVDASALLEVLLQTDAASAIEGRFARGGGLHGPELLDLEVLQVLRRLVTARTISADRADLAVGALERVALRRWSHGAIRRRTWELRGKLSAYDAAYVALAERLRCPLVTRDGRLARSSGHQARIEVL